MLKELPITIIGIATEVAVSSSGRLLLEQGDNSCAVSREEVAQDKCWSVVSLAGGSSRLSCRPACWSRGRTLSCQSEEKGRGCGMD